MRLCKVCRGVSARSPVTGRYLTYCSERCRKSQYGGVCIDCGARTCGANGREKAPQRCWDCSQLRLTTTFVAAGREVARRQHAEAAPKWEIIAALWCDGATLAEIAERVGLSVGGVGSAISLMRRRGEALPYRYAAAAARHVTSP